MINGRLTDYSHNRLYSLEIPLMSTTIEWKRKYLSKTYNKLIFGFFWLFFIKRNYLFYWKKSWISFQIYWRWNSNFSNFIHNILIKCSKKCIFHLETYFIYAENNLQVNYFLSQFNIFEQSRCGQSQQKKELKRFKPNYSNM